jgi:hypothetical protein
LELKLSTMSCLPNLEMDAGIWREDYVL